MHPLRSFALERDIEVPSTVCHLRFRSTRQGSGLAPPRLNEGPLFTASRAPPAVSEATPSNRSRARPRIATRLAQGPA